MKEFYSEGDHISRRTARRMQAVHTIVGMYPAFHPEQQPEMEAMTPDAAPPVGSLALDQSAIIIAA